MVDKYIKLLRKLTESPKSVTITELLKLMELVGFSYRKGSKNHYIFYYKSLTICVAPPHPGKHVKPAYIRECIKAIKELIENDKKN